MPNEDHPNEVYEFSAVQNAVIRDLARKMLVVGIFLIGLGVLALIAFVVELSGPDGEPDPLWIAAAVFFALIGIWTVLAASEFRQVVDTQDEDIAHLMTALAELKKYYALLFWLIVVYLLLILLTILGIPEGLG